MSVASLHIHLRARSIGPAMNFIDSGNNVWMAVCRRCEQQHIMHWCEKGWGGGGGVVEGANGGAGCGIGIRGHAHGTAFRLRSITAAAAATAMARQLRRRVISDLSRVVVATLTHRERGGGGEIRLIIRPSHLHYPLSVPTMDSDAAAASEPDGGMGVRSYRRMHRGIRMKYLFQ